MWFGRLLPSLAARRASALHRGGCGALLLGAGLLWLQPRDADPAPAGEGAPFFAPTIGLPAIFPAFWFMPARRSSFSSSARAPLHALRAEAMAAQIVRGATHAC